MASPSPTPPLSPGHLIQLVSDLAPDDAVGQQVLWLDGVARSMGWTTEIAACRIRDIQGRKILPIRDAGGWTGRAMSADTVVVLHHSIGSVAADAFVEMSGAHRVVIYHNVTPPQLLAGLPHLAALAHWGLRQLSSVVQHADVVIGCSRFNLRDVDRLRPRRTEVVWLAPPPDRLALLRQVAQDRERVARRPDPARPVLLSVGRVVASKNFPAAVRAAAELVRLVPGCQPQLRIVGAIQDQDLARDLVILAESLGLAPRAVILPGAVQAQDLARELTDADILLQPSLHEGFGMPPVEAMHAGVPVIGSASGALPEILGGVCPLFENADPIATAAEVNRLMENDDARNQQISKQFHHAETHFTPDHQADRMKEILAALGPPGSSLGRSSGAQLQ